MPGRLSLPSPLHRRIARHTNLATLFRQPETGHAPAAGQPVISSPAKSATQPVKAHLLPAESRLPEAYLLPSLPFSGEVSVFPEPEPLTAAPAPIQAAPAVSATQPSRPAAPADPPDRVASRPDPSLPLPESLSEDANWRRLETIFRRHQERDESAEEATAPQPENQPAAPASQPMDTALKASPQVEATGQSPAGKDTSADMSAASKPGPIQRQPASPAAPIPRQNLPTNEPAALGEPRPEPAAPPPAENIPAQVEPPATQPTQKLPLEAVWPVQRSPQEPAAPAPISSARQTPSSPDGGIQVAQTEPDADTLIARPPAPPIRPGEAKTGKLVEGHPELQPSQKSRLGSPPPDSPATKPSDSSIEVIQPRHPHPLRPPVSSSEAANQAAALPAESEPPARPDGQPAGAQIQTQKEPFKPQTTSPESSQRPDKSDQLPQPRQVQTEIGPLPEDLWQLLGEEPPGAEDDTTPTPAVSHPLPSQTGLGEPEQRQPSPVQRSAPQELGSQPTTAQPALPRPPEPSVEQPSDLASEQQFSIQRAIAAAEHHPEPATGPTGQSSEPGSRQPAPLGDVLPPIQRLSAGGPVLGSGPSRANTSEDAGIETGSEPDIDALARQVYGQLRRRLEIELERLHRRS